MKRTLTVLTTAGLIAGLSTATAGAAMAASSERVVHTTSTISASQAYTAAAATDATSPNGAAKPEAVPLVVATAFAAPAAAAAGAKVGDWAADKIIGTWDEPTSASNQLTFD